jgi:Cys-rich four helix bundle protein (predicted Tat secretion target)
MNRREMLIGTGAGLAALFTSNAFAMKHAKDSKTGHGYGKKFENLVDSGLNCLKKGEACIQHCLAHFGDTSLAECAARVQEMMPVCATLAKLASYESKHLKDYLQFCIKVCNDCEKACRVHEATHKPCKECADACANCAKQCEKVLASL